MWSHSIPTPTATIWFFFFFFRLTKRTVCRALICHLKWCLFDSMLNSEDCVGEPDLSQFTTRTDSYSRLWGDFHWKPSWLNLYRKYLISRHTAGGAQVQSFINSLISHSCHFLPNMVLDTWSKTFPSLCPPRLLLFRQVVVNVCHIGRTSRSPPRCSSASSVLSLYRPGPSLCSAAACHVLQSSGRRTPVRGQLSGSRRSLAAGPC